MARIRVHKEDCEVFLGNNYEKIHLFLDQYINKYPISKFDDRHRSYLHNSYGLAIIKEQWGQEAEIAGLIHLYRDWYHTRPFTLNRIINNKNKLLMLYNNLEEAIWYHQDNLRRE